MARKDHAQGSSHAIIGLDLHSEGSTDHAITANLEIGLFLLAGK